MTDFIQVFTTVDDEAKARALARAVVEARLAACAQVLGYQQRLRLKWSGCLARGNERGNGWLWSRMG